MQLKRSRLAAATLGLLGSAMAPAPAAAQFDLELPPEQSSRKWEFDTGMLVYAESGGRVQAAEPVIKATRRYADDREVSFKLVLDTLTGASPNGATPASTPQTFTGPSGNGSYSAAPGELPLDDSFKDTRVSLSADYLFPVSADGKFGYGFNASKEYDFLSAGASARYSLDFNQGNTTVSAGLSYEADEISPVGGTPEPMALMPAPVAPSPEPEPEFEDEDDDDEGGSAQTKGVTDVVLGLTQVLDPHSLVQFNYSLSTSSGYHTDPYKVLSVVGTDGEPLRYVYESRPESRTKHALFARYKRFLFARDVFDVSYRFMTDDWAVQSNTVDTLYRWNFTSTDYLEPHLRWYTQSAAEFYRAALFDGEEVGLDFASADPRLGAFTGYTFGLKYGHTLPSGNSWSARLEYYQQTGQREGVPDAAAAGLEKFALEPDLSAVMFTVGYKFKW
jgi:hypothetical protein